MTKFPKILFLLVPLCLVVLLMAFSNALLNCWMLLIEPNYIIPKESNIFQFDVNQMNEGSGDWWIYGQDNKTTITISATTHCRILLFRMVPLKYVVASIN